ncbi:MAG TPA: hypothetical protein VMT83_17250 [Burkholderiaceae bacterium]|nr:hypothetical protein [Burkholderiaceae bacterium]
MHTTRLFRICLAVTAISACAAASASVVHVYEWSERGGTPVLSNAMPPPGIAQYTIQDVVVPPLGKAQRDRIQCRLAADRAALEAPPLRQPDDPGLSALALGDDPTMRRQ